MYLFFYLNSDSRKFQSQQNLFLKFSCLKWLLIVHIFMIGLGLYVKDPGVCDFPRLWEHVCWILSYKNRRKRHPQKNLHCLIHCLLVVFTVAETSRSSQCNVLFSETSKRHRSKLLHVYSIENNIFKKLCSGYVRVHYIVFTFTCMQLAQWQC